MCFLVASSLFEDILTPNAYLGGFMIRSSFLIMMMILLAPLTSAHASPGDLNTSYGNGGLNALLNSGTIHPAATLPNGDRLLATSLNGTLYLKKLKADSSIDSTFGESGTAHYPFKFVVRHVTTSPDGRVIVLAMATDKTYSLYSFIPDEGPDGAHATHFSVGTWNDWDLGRALATTEFIYLAGFQRTVNNVANPAMVVLRYTPGGELDPSFGDHGKMLHDLSTDPSHAEKIETLITSPDGGVLTCGIDGTNLTLLHITANGTLDPNFGTNGHAVIQSISPDVASCRAVKLYESYIVIAGVVSGYPFITELTSAGKPHGSFNDGVVLFLLPTTVDEAAHGPWDFLATPDGFVILSSRPEGIALSLVSYNGHILRLGSSPFDSVQTLFVGYPRSLLADTQSHLMALGQFGGMLGLVQFEGYPTSKSEEPTNSGDNQDGDKNGDGGNEAPPPVDLTTTPSDEATPSSPVVLQAQGGAEPADGAEATSNVGSGGSCQLNPKATRKTVYLFGSALMLALFGLVLAKQRRI